MVEQGSYDGNQAVISHVCLCGHGLKIHEEIHNEDCLGRETCDGLPHSVDEYGDCNCSFGPAVGKCLAVEGCECESFAFPVEAEEEAFVMEGDTPDV